VTSHSTPQEQSLLMEGGGKIKLENRHQVQLIAQQIAQRARQHIEILTYDLDAPLYDNPLFLGAVTKLARANRDLCLRVLLQNNEKVQKEGHRLIELARRLTSKIEIRKPHPDFQDLRQFFMVVDTQDYFRCPNHQRYEGEAELKAPFKARELMQLYNEIWESSEPDSDLRRLYL